MKNSADRQTKWVQYGQLLLNKNLFDVLPGCYIILQPNKDFVILHATKEYLQVSNSTEEIIGKPLFAIFPDNPADPNASGVKNLTASLTEVIRTHTTHRMAIQRYDTRKPGTADFEIRYWAPVNKPVFDEEGKLIAIIHVVDEVTDKVLLKQRLAARDQNMQQQITDAIVTTQELERMEISRELHDNVNQILLTARLYIGRAMEKENPDRNMLRAGYDLLDKAVEEIRKISLALVQTSAEEESITASIENMLQQVMSYGSIKVHKLIRLPDESLIESKVKTAIFRIVQEQLSNVIKHADAKNLFINIEFVKGSLKLTIKDDGKGFYPAVKKSGLGFQNMKSRVAVIDGIINIHSKPGDGCTIEVHIPLQR